MNAALKYDILDESQEDFDNDYYDYQDDDQMIDTLPLCKLSVYDLGAVDHYVCISRNKKFGFDVTVQNEEDSELFEESGMHPCALESMAAFCRQFLNSYSNLMDEELA